MNRIRLPYKEPFKKIPNIVDSYVFSTSEYDEKSKQWICYSFDDYAPALEYYRSIKDTMRCYLLHFGCTIYGSDLAFKFHELKEQEKARKKQLKKAKSN